MRVIGTAGHVDHGKSTLIAALTGTHPDRLKEEQAREMTIELGFGWLTMPNGEEVGIVDVPGHRDFIENMLSGIGGIDAALLVIAADEGVMPQTKEHLAILDLLQIPAGLIVLTKTDLASDPAWLDLLEMDIRGAVSDTVLRDAPILRVSAKNKTGLDTLITIPNQRLLSIAGNHMSFMDAFKKADEVLLNAVQGISDLINHTGLINTDFADVRTIMANKGLALMGTGMGEGEHRAVEAATNAISSPLLENISVDGATGLIINVTGGPDLTAFEVNEATTLIMEAAHEDAEIIFGSVIDENMKNKVKITVIATGIGANAAIEQVLGAGAATMSPNAIGPERIQAPSHTPSPSLAHTQAATLSSLNAAPVTAPAPAFAAPAPSYQNVQPPPPPVTAQAAPVIPESRPLTPPAPTPSHPAPRASMNAASIDSIIPSATMAEVDSRMLAEQPAATLADSIDGDFGIVEEETLPKPAHMAAPAPAAKPAMPAMPTPPTPAARMEQVEMFERKADATSADDGFGARNRDQRAESYAKAQQIARSLGVGSLTDDEYDIPTFIRRQQQNNSTVN